MIVLRYIVFFLLPLFVNGEEWNIIAIRDLYYKAAVSKGDTEKFKSVLYSIQHPNSCIKGYIGVAYMIEAKHLYNPASKLSFFNDGKNLLEHAIKNEPDNLELRFLRIAVQSNTPAFLGYNSQIETDKKIILSNYALHPDKDLKRRIRDFMIQSDICSEQEKQIFRQ